MFATETIITAKLAQIFAPFSVAFCEAQSKTDFYMYHIQGFSTNHAVSFTCPPGGYFSAFRRRGNEYSVLLFVKPSEFLYHYENVSGN